jgi:hypothetical protein
LALAALLPFLGKAFTVDDPWFLLEAKQILKTPLQPMSFEICWMGNETCLKRADSLGAGAAQGLMGFFLVPSVLAGGSEWIAHAMQLLVTCLAVLAIAKLALRLGFDRVQAAFAGVLLVAIPPFLPMANTAMPDVLASTLGLIGVERLLAWRDEHRWHQAVVSSVALGLAPYGRPHLALLLPLGALWLLNEIRIKPALAQIRRQFGVWTPIVMAGLLLLSINLVMRQRGPISDRVDTLVDLSNIPRNLSAYFLYLVFPIPLAAVWLGIEGRRRPLLLILPLVPTVVAHLMLHRTEPVLQEWPVAAMFYGMAVLAGLVFRVWKTGCKDRIMLSLWILLPLPLVYYAHLPIKYALAAMPAIVLTIIGCLWSLPARRAFAIAALMTLLCATYSCIILRADADFAEYGRRASAELVAPYVAKGERVWFGGQWGFYWYALKAGAQVSKPGVPGPLPGDLLVVGVMEGGTVTRDRFPNRELIATRIYDSPHGRTMGYGAGLYSNSFGSTLWVWNPLATNTYELWRVK